VIQIPERLINFRVYAGPTSLDQVGMTDVELPNFDLMTESISGAGIAGEYDSVVLGHFKSMAVKLKWASVTALATQLLIPVQQTLDIRGSVQLQDPALGSLVTQALRIECRGQLKNLGLGKFEPGKRMDAVTEIECAVLRVFLDGVSLVEVDKFNMSFKVNGFDYLQQVRVDMGGI
jgi:P2 family phage contractile tail tube protein